MYLLFLLFEARTIYSTSNFGLDKKIGLQVYNCEIEFLQKSISNKTLANIREKLYYSKYDPENDGQC